MSVLQLHQMLCFYGVVNDDLKLLTCYTQLLTAVGERGLTLVPVLTELSQALVRLNDCSSLIYHLLESADYDLAVSLRIFLPFQVGEKCFKYES